MKAFVVTVAKEIEVVVLANSEVEARRIAENDADAILSESDEADVNTRSLDKERSRWMRAFPYTKDGESDRTLQEMIESKEVVL